jgi:hypothetical protein
VFENPPIQSDDKLYKTLSWQPSLHVKLNKYLDVLVEVSEDSPYPIMLSRRHGALLSVHQPLAVYSACPAEVFLLPSKQSELKELERDGYGLLTVDKEGNVSERIHAIPLIHRVSDSEFKASIDGLPAGIRQRLAQCFQTYKNKPPVGIGEIAELLEGLVLEGGRRATKKNWLAGSQVVAGRPAKTLDALSACSHTKAHNAAWGGVRSYIKEYRNVAHHYVTKPKDAKRKFLDCRHALIAGIQHTTSFLEAFRKLKLLVRLQ